LHTKKKYQKKLLEFFVLEVTARSTADLPEIPQYSRTFLS